MKVFYGKNVNTIFYEASRVLFKYGKQKTVCDNLGKDVEYKELRPVLIEFQNSLNNLLLVPHRNMNPFAQIAEGLWVLAGRQDVRFMDNFNSKLKNYSDDGNVYRAPYGYRLRRFFIDETVRNGEQNYYVDQIANVVKTLKEDPRSRRAVACIWDPRKDNTIIKTKDTPCNDLLMFKVEDNKLDMTVINRSNDLMLGLFNVNIIQFSFIQALVAASISKDIGTYYHYSDSLHIYEHQYELLDNILRSPRFCYYDFLGDNNLKWYFDRSINYDESIALIEDWIDWLDINLKDGAIDSTLIFRDGVETYLEGIANFEIFAYKYQFSHELFYDGIEFISIYPLVRLINNRENMDGKFLLEKILIWLNTLKRLDWVLAGIIFVFRKFINIYGKDELFKNCEDLLGKYISPSNKKFIIDFLTIERTI